MSLIPRVRGKAARAELENNLDSERLRLECCADYESPGTSCATVAASGIFCKSDGEKRYQFTQFADGGVLVPADGASKEYLERVGEEEYMVVDMIEPFETNSKVWGFNLLSSDARLKAWRNAMSTGRKTFTRRLNLVQSESLSEYGFLVWLPIFENAEGEWRTVFSGGVDGLTAVGSVNGVYSAQRLLSRAISSTYSVEQLANVEIFLFDDAEELQGKPQFLAAYNAPAGDPYIAYGDSMLEDVTREDDLHEMVARVNLTADNADVRWVVVVQVNADYLRSRRSSNPIIALILTGLLLVGSTMERWLGHPKWMLKAIRRNQVAVEASFSTL